MTSSSHSDFFPIFPPVRNPHVHPRHTMTMAVNINQKAAR
jgi:hypothetical protein